MAVRLSPRLECVLVFPRALADADRGQPPAGKGARRLASKFHVGLLVVAGLHVAAALMHLFYYRDGVMRRMLLGGPAIKAFVAE